MTQRTFRHETAVVSPQKGWLFLFIPNEVLGETRRVFLSGTLNGKPFRATANAWQDNAHVITVNQQMRRELGIGEGDTVVLDCAVSLTPPEIPLDADVAAALDATPGARAAWDALGYNKRQERLDHVRQARRPDTRAARIAALAEWLVAR
jgi:hypothetical protein